MLAHSSPQTSSYYAIAVDEHPRILAATGTVSGRLFAPASFPISYVYLSQETCEHALLRRTRFSARHGPGPAWSQSVAVSVRGAANLAALERAATAGLQVVSAVLSLIWVLSRCSACDLCITPLMPVYYVHFQSVTNILRLPSLRPFTIWAHRMSIPASLAGSNHSVPSTMYPCLRAASDYRTPIHRGGT